MERLSVRDKRTITLQIGRTPRGLSAISRRCRYGFPQVIRVHPIVDAVPFPTLYWLTCPFLTRRIDRLEAGGWIGRLEQRLGSDPGLQARLRVAREAYIRERYALLSEAERREVDARGWEENLLGRGIGGIAEANRIKCLHLHVAHALVAENPVGALVLGILDRAECPAEEVICSTRGRVEQIDQINR